MKKIISYSLVICCLVALGLANMSCSRSIDASFHHDGVASKQLKAVFNDLGISIDSLAQANEFAQKNLLRSGERWDAQAENELNARIREHQEQVIEHLKAFNMIDAINPAQKNYTYALLMGALKSRVAQRLEYLTELTNSGYTFEYVVLLGGERQLRAEEKEGMPENVNTEADMMNYLCAQNPDLAGKNIILVNAPMIQKPDGTFTRPTTDSTLIHFQQIAPKDGSCLVISNNPYIVRQTKVAQRILDQSRFPTEGAGPALNEKSTGILIVMDELARTIYEEYVRFTATK